MMNSVQKLRNLKTTIEEITDSLYDDLTEAVQALKDAAGREDHTYEDMLVQGGISGDYVNDRISGVKAGCFQMSYDLTSVKMDNVETVDSNAFTDSGITAAGFPNVRYAGPKAFYMCGALKWAELGNAEYLDTEAFRECYQLNTVILAGSQVCQLDANVFKGTPIESGTGFVYVPRALLAAYEAEPCWTAYRSQLRAMEDHPEVCNV